MATATCLPASTLLLLALTVTATVLASKYKVIQEGPCRAELFVFGRVAGRVDLTSLDSHNTTVPGFAVPGAGYIFQYNPCSGIKHLNNPLQTVYQTDSQARAYYDAGSLNSTKFEINEDNKLQLHYWVDIGDRNARRSIVVLECDAEAEAANLTFTVELPAGCYNFLLRWADFCHVVPPLPLEHTPEQSDRVNAVRVN